MGYLRNFFSGVEGNSHFEAAVNSGAQNVLVSYLYLEKKGLDVIKKRKKKYPHVNFMIDSGAHTFQASYAKAPYDKWKVKDYEAYLVRYVDFLRKYKKYIFCAVELDIDFPLVVAIYGNKPGLHLKEDGLRIVKEWQKKYFKPLEEEGLPIIYVWHDIWKMQGFEEMCRECAYVGIPGELSSDVSFNKFITVARRYTTKLHGFAASVTGDSKLIIKSSSGIISEVTIEKLYNQCTSYQETAFQEIRGFLSEPTKTWTLTNNLKSSFKNIKSIFKHTVLKPIYEIKLRGGKTVKGTGDHSFFALDKSGNLIEVKPSDLKKGDFLVSSLGIPEANQTSLSLEDAEFLGLWFGDGYVGLRADKKPSSIWVSKQHQKSILRCCQNAAKRKNKKWSRVPNSVDGYFTDTVFASWIVENFGRVGEDKFIGSYLLSSSEKIKAAFLRGYFSADGCAKGKNRLISLSCFRRDILETVQLMLESWDIRSSITDAGVSGKGGHTWELAISDVLSRKMFESEIGFIQKDQRKALSRKNKTKAIAGCHRGLPVSLLKSGRIYRKNKNKIESRPVYPKDRRTAEIPENFCSKLLEMECEYLEIKNIRLVSNEAVTVYDLEVPSVERFYANGVLAHNTKQTDFRDWPWQSIDSTTWKSSEIYGTLIDWDSAHQKLTFEEDKSARVHYQQKFQKFGFDAQAIIQDKNYKEVTRYALFSISEMEKFYKKRFSTRTFYYELRLPHPAHIESHFSVADVIEERKRFKVSELFSQHASEDDLAWKEYFEALASVQYRDIDRLKNEDKASFLAAYFPSHITPDGDVSDMDAFQKELANFISPKNDPPMKRRLSTEYIPSNNPPKKREDDLSLEPLDHDDEHIKLLEI